MRVWVGVCRCGGVCMCVWRVVGGWGERVVKGGCLEHVQESWWVVVEWGRQGRLGVLTESSRPSWQQQCLLDKQSGPLCA